MKKYSTDVIKAELPKLIIDTVAEFKPPSRIKEVLLWFLMGLGGGAGIGVLIAFLRW